VIDQGLGTVGPEESPALTVAEKLSRPGLDLDQEEPAAAHHQQIYFVDGTVLGDELHVGPGPVRLMARQARPNKSERFTLMGPRRRSF
jgi:hypothetical protein